MLWSCMPSPDDSGNVGVAVIIGIVVWQSDPDDYRAAIQVMRDCNIGFLYIRMYILFFSNFELWSDQY